MVYCIKKELGPETKVVATGGFSRLFENERGLFNCIDQRLPLEGIRMVYENRPKEV